MSPVLLALLLSGPGCAVEAWPPPVPGWARSERALLGRRPLQPATAEAGLQRLAQRGPWRQEAAAAQRWAGGRQPLFLLRERGVSLLMTAEGEGVPLSPALASALSRIDEYFSLVPGARSRPLSPAELSAALVSKEGVRRVRGLFDRAVGERIEVVLGVPVPRVLEEAPGREIDSDVLIPELGGEALLDPAPRFIVFDEPTRPVLKRLAASIAEPQALRRLYDEYPAEMKILDAENSYSLLRLALERIPWLRGRGLTEAQIQRDVQRCALTVIQNGAAEFVLDPDAQLDAILANRWSGRYLGLWHIHPPHFSAAGWTEGVPLFGERHGLVPSEGDVGIARSQGQFLTVVFRKDGFDAYDLSTERPEGLEDFPARRISYHSPEWRRHFDGLHSAVKAGIARRIMK